VIQSIDIIQIMELATSISSFIEKAKVLINLERQEELEEASAYRSLASTRELEEKGVFLNRLVAADERVGLYGRCLITFEKPHHQLLPVNKFRLRDIVEVQQNRKPLPVQGVVYRKRDAALVIAFESHPGDLSGTLGILRLGNDITYQRYQEGLDFLASIGRGLASADVSCLRMFDCLFAGAPPRLTEVKQRLSWTPINPGLNAEQIFAVDNALAAQDLYLIHGPPGTGKTTTVVELIVQATKRGEKVLACASSNIAVDNMAERLALYGVKVCRVGHPARLLPTVLDVCLDALVLGSEEAQLCKDIRNEMTALLRKAKKSHQKSERFALRAELNELRKELRNRERKQAMEVLDSCAVILATNLGAANKTLKKYDKFELVVIDEAAQALEVECILPLFKGKKCVLAGDHKQLGPTVTSETAAKLGLGTADFRLCERLLMMHMWMYVCRHDFVRAPGDGRPRRGPHHHADGAVPHARRHHGLGQPRDVRWEARGPRQRGQTLAVRPPACAVDGGHVRAIRVGRHLWRRHGRSGEPSLRVEIEPQRSGLGASVRRALTAR
jgi:ATP-dependent RNA/DNA helicase IGHMBP2